MAGGSVPSNLAGLFVAAGKQYGIPAAVLAGVSSVESNIFRNTGPSSAGAIGGMQFEPGTARGLGVNPNDPRSAIFGAAKYLTQLGYHSNPLRALGAYNGGPGNPQYGYANQVMAEARRLAGTFHGGPTPASSSSFTVPGTPSIPQVPGTTGPTSFNLTRFDRSGFDQARKAYVLGSFLKESAKDNPWGGPSTASALAPLFAAGKLSSTPPDQSQFFHTQTYKLAQNALQGLAGTAPLKVHPGTVNKFSGYVNPLGKAQGLVPERVDMGQDFAMRPGSPIVAIGDSRVVNIYPNWYRGQPYVLLQLLNGPKRGQYYYVAEQIAPSVKPGQVVHAGDPIGRYASSGTGIEMGWGTSGSQTLAQAQGNTGDASHGNAPAGVAFSGFLKSLGL